MRGKRKREGGLQVVVGYRRAVGAGIVTVAALEDLGMGSVG